MKNKYQEALNTIKPTTSRPDLIEKTKKIQELVDKETPMKPVVLTKTIYCSKCDMRLGDNNGWTQATVGFCPSCGQKIDWSKDE